MQIYSWREGQASSLCLHALWVWSKKLHWNEICSAAGKDGPHWDCQQVQDCAGSRDKGEVVLAGDNDLEEFVPLKLLYSRFSV